MAQDGDIAGWRPHPYGHFILYVAEGTPGARDAVQVATELERIYTRGLAPLSLPPVTVLYPLYPSMAKFQSDWWQFAIRASGETVFGWGTIYDGQPGRISPYVVTRTVIAHTFPRAIPLLKWGLGDALADRLQGIDSHRGLRVLLHGGRTVPSVEAIVSPYEFGTALPLSYPAAVSFVAFLLDEYGPGNTAEFINAVGYRYYDFGRLFEEHFGRPLGEVELAWNQRVARQSEASALNVTTYVRGIDFMVSTTLAAAPSRSMLRPEGAVIVNEAFAAIVPLRSVNLTSIETHLAVVRMVEARQKSRARWTALAVRGGFWVFALAPIVLALVWLAWPKIRAHLNRQRQRRHGNVS